RAFHVTGVQTCALPISTKRGIVTMRSTSIATELGIALTLTALAATPAGAQSTEPNAAGSAGDNPLLAPSPLPLRYPPFDLIEDEHFAPALERGMAEHLEEIEAIAKNPEPPTFENTIVALERSGELLERAATTFFSLASADTNERRQAIEAEFAPKLAAHQDAILLNSELFARVDGLHARRDTLGLDPEAIRLIERYHIDFVRAGARLSEEEKARLREINAELARLSTEFSQNVLAEVNDSAVIVERREELEGLSEAAVAGHPRGAERRRQPRQSVRQQGDHLGSHALASRARAAARLREPCGLRARRRNRADARSRRRDAVAARAGRRGERAARRRSAASDDRSRAGRERRAFVRARAVGLGVLCRESPAGVVRVRRERVEALSRAR